MQHLTIPVLDEKQQKVISQEVLEAEPTDDGCWRLLHSPAFVWGVARGDVLRLDPSTLCGFVLVARAGNVAVVVASPSGEEAACRRILEPEIVELGGVCEGGPPRMLVFSIPVAIGFPTIEALFIVRATALPAPSGGSETCSDRTTRRSTGG